jgi:hypothetical protein
VRVRNEATEPETPRKCLQLVCFFESGWQEFEFRLSQASERAATEQERGGRGRGRGRGREGGREGGREDREGEGLPPNPLTTGTQGACDCTCVHVCARERETERDRWTDVKRSRARGERIQGEWESGEERESPCYCRRRQGTAAGPPRRTPPARSPSSTGAARDGWLVRLTRTRSLVCSYQGSHTFVVSNSR